MSPIHTNTRILIVDDTPENLAVLGDVLQPDYTVQATTSGERALAIAAAKPAPDLILLDIMMPGMDGYTVLGRLRQNPATRDIPVVFLTALTDTQDEEHGLALGAVDYITKPIRPALVLARVRTQIEAKRTRDVLRDHNAFLEAEIARRMADNEHIQAVSIRALAHLAEIRDTDTGNHLLRTQAYVHRLATCLSDHPRFAATLTPHYVDLLARSAPLHDIGKVGIPDHILLKPGKLDDDEWKIMQTHSALGATAIEQAERDVSEALPFLSLAKEIARSHHEHWDGTGYPDGLAGEAIPISARLMALADVFDALVHARTYKPGMPPEEARDIIVAGRGSHFDPAVVDCFENNFTAFVDIAERYNDAD
ncbi:MAG TPA: response regulator [Denitromonas sp.]|uniref:HD domain-containing phosphohydrolase n=1 Tax=Denitromonas sp. TaxID=2734609 RepID=UPI002BEFD36B|nr:response regulator [Zoogloeaceae bacterium]HQU89754.1 response regulator [Denitromonas sp.]HQV15934.1 response regulator [Denitromonas sp.]